MSRSPASIRIEGLWHRYPGAQRHAIEDVGFALEPGLRLGLLGPNGAGKSTLMRILCGYLPISVPPTGRRPRVEVAGLDVHTASLAVRDRVGYLPEQVPLYAELRVREHLAFRARIKRVARKLRGREIERVAELTGISDKLETPIGQLSRGYRQRVGISDALLGEPPLLVLDEPTVGLDPNQVLDVRAMLRDVGGGQTLVFSSHILSEVEALCDRVVILSEGKVVADESLDEALAAGHVHVRWLAPEERVRRVLAAAWSALDLDGEPQVRLEGADDAVAAEIALPHPDGPDPGAVLEALGRASAEHQAPIALLSRGRTRLEQRFAEVTGARDG